MSQQTSPWTTKDMPPQTGKFAIVTGANSGIGYEMALALARAGATVVVACRNAERGHGAVGRIVAAAPGAQVSFEALDLASLASVAAFAARMQAGRSSVDILVNNAGLMMLPKRRVTADGFEMQLGTNYLGHFALTAQLLPLLAAGHARVVQLSSIAAKRGAINFDDLQAAGGYNASKAYGQSKLAMLMFALELRRRSDAAGWHLLSMAAHPGVATTAIIPNGVGTGIMGKFMKFVVGIFGQSPAAGALPPLFAATSPDAAPGGYYGSTGFQEVRGPAGNAVIVPQARDLAAAARLWEVSEQLTGVKFALTEPQLAPPTGP